MMESLIFQKPNTVTVLTSQGAQSAEVVIPVTVGGQPIELMPEGRIEGLEAWTTWGLSQSDLKIFLLMQTNRECLSGVTKETTTD